MIQNYLSRRKFLATTSIAAAGSLLTGSAGGTIIKNAGTLLEAGLPADMEPWYDRTMRWVQVVFTEGDGGKYDPQWWLDLFKRARVDGICLVAGGMTAFYPSRINYHPRAVCMKDGHDMFGEMAIAAKKMGITVVARTDAQACTKEAAAAHPEWLNIDENGNPRIHRSLPDKMVGTCAMGDYNFVHMTAIHREIMEMYQVDGLFCNRWQAWARGMCYCNTCRSLFKAYSGLELPRKQAEREAIERYAAWETQRLTDLWKLWDGEMRKINPGSRYFSNVGLDLDRASELAPTYMSETQQRGNNPPWHVGEQGKRMQAIFGPHKKIIALTGMTLSSRNSVAPEPEISMWLLNGITNGLSPWLIKSSAVNWDNRWIPALEKVYKWHAANEKYLKNLSNLANVAVLFRKDGPRNPLLGTGAATVIGADRDIDPDGRKLNPDIPANDNNAAAGIYQALVEARIPFVSAYSGKLDDFHPDRYKVLILPNLANLSDEECVKIRQYVHRGGSIVATFETSLYNNGERRQNFALSDLFGVNDKGSSESNGPNAYMRVEHGSNHPILKGLEQTTQIISSSRRVNVSPNVALPPAPLTRIPNFPTDPMEQIFPRIPKTDIPEVYTRSLGKNSRIVYFPGDVDSTFAGNMSPDLGLLIKNAVVWAANEPQPVVVTGPGLLEVTCWQQQDSMTVHLFNCTNPFMLRAAYREQLTVGAQQVRIVLPLGKTVKQVNLLVAGTRVPSGREGRFLTLTVPQVTDHEVIAIDFV